ncbi:hypothetical protein MIND_00191500 [Mycena indigotica]|uniref:Uncharacterized protein n=1 Tax=Mycena indigotica TaxID=2126181 RepID=A0A8H6T4A0_9AGAR|nr:uncharacterized protein MIND_00191500 [Mycena indigotica]KAF7311810.1 hypothetical protein MIND_00191500 [Mycena indigotica]
MFLLVIANSNASCIASIDNGPKRRHSACIPALQHALFCSETSLGVADDWEGPGECDSGGETDDEFEIDDILMRDEDDLMTPTPTPRSRRTTASESAAASNAAGPSAAGSIGPVPVANTVNSPTPSAVISFRIRGHGAVFTDYEPPAGTPAMRSIHFAPDLAAATFKAASEGNLPAELLIEGETNAEMAQSLIHIAEECFSDGLYDLVLSSDRIFRRIKVDPITGDKMPVADGIGVEREVVFAAFQFFTEKHAGAFLLPRADNYCSIATSSFIHNPGAVSAARKASMGAFGCVTALMLVHQMAPTPLIPGIILLPVCRFDMRCFTRSFVQQLHPELAADIDRVKDAGHAGSLSASGSHFFSFHSDVQLALFNQRTEPQHEALLSEMVLRGIVGDQSPDGPESVAWYSGLNSLCSNGFSVLEADFEAIRATLDSQIQFDQADDLAFRSRIAAWAITGSPHLPSRNELGQIKISFVLPTEPIYMACVRNTQFHYDSGNILFRACFRSAYIPYGFLVKLCANPYPTLDGEGNPIAPHTLEEAIDNWLFLQFINAIGGHTVV